MDNIFDKKKEYLDRNIFFGLTNLNTGFDAVGIKYFSEKDFEIVLNRVKQHGLGIKGIEPWKNGEFYQVLTYEEFTNDSTDPKWYMKAFESFKEDHEDLQYAATYYIPEKLFSDED
ncbi:hypothetical protein [Ferruginibacter profundus]